MPCAKSAAEHTELAAEAATEAAAKVANAAAVAAAEAAKAHAAVAAVVVPSYFQLPKATNMQSPSQYSTTIRRLWQLEPHPQRKQQPERLHK